jgi:hypothetical protein
MPETLEKEANSKVTGEHRTDGPGINNRSEWAEVIGLIAETVSVRELRRIEKIGSRELRRIEANIAALLSSAVDRALVGLLMIALTIVGGGCLIAAMVLLLGLWCPWWLSLALVGTAALAAGRFFYVGKVEKAHEDHPQPALFAALRIAGIRARE